MFKDAEADIASGKHFLICRLMLIEVHVVYVVLHNWVEQRADISSEVNIVTNPGGAYIFRIFLEVQLYNLARDWVAISAISIRIIARLSVEHNVT